MTRLCTVALLGASILAAQSYDVRKFGARGDLKTNDAAAIQAAIDACARAGGGTVIVPPGRYLSGTLELKSNVGLHLEAGAAIYASKQKAHFKPSAAHGDNRGVLLTANKVENISVTGMGTLHGQGEPDFGKRWGATEDGKLFRTGLILFTESRNVTLRDFTILYSDFWTLHLKRCETVSIDNVKILNNTHRLNSDGIDLTSCRNVHIANCHIVAGDDAIDPKSEGGYPVENVVVTNCTLETTTTGIKLGTATDGDFRNLHFSNITINAPSGIGFYMKDGGTAENITFSNITIETPARTYREVTPIFMDIERRHKDSRLSHIRDISLRDIQIRSGSGILIQGSPESYVENLSIDNLSFRVTKPDDFAERFKPVGGGRTTKDERDTKYIRMPSYFSAAYIDGLHLNNIRILQDAQALAAYERSALLIHESKNVTIRGVNSTTPKGPAGLPVIAQKNNENVVIAETVR